MINHQYSKTFEFEKNFRDYLHKYICPKINYFSFLRPINELQIAKLFSVQKKHLFSFRSCNRGSKNNSWCCECSKCLFTYIILSPYIEQKTLEKVFGKNILDDKNVLGIFNELIGITTNKPFECIGTIDEVNTALNMTIQNRQTSELEYLLKYYTTLRSFDDHNSNEWNTHLTQFEKNNFVPQKPKEILIKALCLKI